MIKQPSIRGRGLELLLATPPSAEMTPRRKAATPVQPVHVRPGSPPLDLEDRFEGVADAPSRRAPIPARQAEESLEEALYEEARTAVTDAERAGGQVPVPAENRLPKPGDESALVREVVPPANLPESLAEAPDSLLEAEMEEERLLEERILYEPPPPETVDIIRGVLPPRPARLDLGAAPESASVSDIQSPGGRVERLVLPERELPAEENARVLAELGDDRLQELDDEIDEMYRRVLAEVGESDAIATECYNQLLKARDIILRRDAAQISQAEYYVEQVRARLKRAATSAAAAKRSTWWIAGWGILWFAALTSVLLLLNFGWFRELLLPPGATNLPVNLEVLLPAMVWGGIGGVSAVFYSLFKHVSHRDFDSQYNLSYVGKPFLGIILGATVYMVVNVLVLALGIVPVGILEDTALSSAVIMPWLIYLLGWACGFNENRIFDLVDRVIRQVFGIEGSTA